MSPPSLVYSKIVSSPPRHGPSGPIEFTGCPTLLGSDHLWERPIAAEVFGPLTLLTQTGPLLLARIVMGQPPPHARPFPFVSALKWRLSAQTRILVIFSSWYASPRFETPDMIGRSLFRRSRPSRVSVPPTFNLSTHSVASHVKFRLHCLFFIPVRSGFSARDDLRFSRLLLSCIPPHGPFHSPTGRLVALGSLAFHPHSRRERRLFELQHRLLPVSLAWPVKRADLVRRIAFTV